jgi:hypothetical protein
MTEDVTTMRPLAAADCEEFESDREAVVSGERREVLMLPASPRFA